MNDTSEEEAINPLTVLKKLTASEKVATFDCVNVPALTKVELTVRFSQDISLVLKCQKSVVLNSEE